MDLKTRLEIIDKIRDCPMEKCNTQGEVEFQTPEAYEAFKRGIIRCIESMNNDRQVIVTHHGMSELITIDINLVLGLFDPIIIEPSGASPHDDCSWCSKPLECPICSKAL